MNIPPADELIDGFNNNRGLTFRITTPAEVFDEWEKDYPSETIPSSEMLFDTLIADNHLPTFSEGVMTLS